MLEAGKVERLGVFADRVRRLGDRRRRLGWNDPEPSLGAGKGGLDLGAAGEKREIAEHRAHRPGAEHVAEQRRNEHADCHPTAAGRSGFCTA